MPRSRSRSMVSSTCSRIEPLLERAGGLDQPVGQGGLAVVDVGDDAEVADSGLPHSPNISVPRSAFRVPRLNRSRAGLRLGPAHRARHAERGTRNGYFALPCPATVPSTSACSWSSSSGAATSPSASWRSSISRRWRSPRSGSPPGRRSCGSCSSATSRGPGRRASSGGSSSSSASWGIPCTSSASSSGWRAPRRPTRR